MATAGGPAASDTAGPVAGGTPAAPAGRTAAAPAGGTPAAPVGRTAAAPVGRTAAAPVGRTAAAPAPGADHIGGSGRSSHSGAPTQEPVPPGVVTPAVISRSLPVAGGAAGIVNVVVSTARSGATLASPTWQPSLRSSRRTSAAAPRSESTDPLRPRVATRSAPISRSPSRNATSVVAFPTSTPAVTVTDPTEHRPASPHRQQFHD